MECYKNGCEYLHIFANCYRITLLVYYLLLLMLVSGYTYVLFHGDDLI